MARLEYSSQISVSAVLLELQADFTVTQVLSTVCTKLGKCAHQASLVDRQPMFHKPYTLDPKTKL